MTAGKSRLAHESTPSWTVPGPLTLVAADGALVGLYQEDQRHRPAPDSFGVPDPAPLPPRSSPN